MALAAGENGRGDLLQLGGREDEHEVLRRLLENFQQRVEGRVREHVIIDCGSAIYFDELSTIAILEADAVLRLINCDLKSVSYLSSQQEYLRMAGFDFDKLYKAVSNVKSNEASQNMQFSFSILQMFIFII